MTLILATEGESDIDSSYANGTPADRVASPFRPDIAGGRPQHDEL
jgi:hypothetical protein